MKRLEELQKQTEIEWLRDGQRIAEREKDGGREAKVECGENAV